MADENDGVQVNCRVGSLIILFAALTGNIVELVLCVVKKSFQTPGQILIHSLAVIDAILAAVLLARVIFATSTEKISNVNVVARIGSVVLLLSICLVQLAHVLAIGGERLLAVRYPLRFQKTHTKSNIRKLLFIIWLIPCILGAAIGTLCGWSGNERGIYYALSAAYSVTAVFLSVLYYQLIKRRRNNHLNVNPCRRNKNKAEDSNSVSGIRAAGDSRDKLLLILSIGITGTFFLLNTPIIVYGLLFDVQSLTCGSPEGLFLALATSSGSVNLVTDPLLYFFITYRIRTRQASIRKKTQQRNVKPKQVHSLYSIQKSGLFENGSDIQRLK
eukprot:Seg4051.1 transcript_id=Seg4051.1/GoldUCD/mRNA.D3Y31 product="G-protein coupled receptor 52" protein_id=Seg4051.1/GoldUCD/D3Y31